jgi:putative SOS response-associated peptidase YedK
MDSFYEPNWESGKAIRWRIKRADGEPAVAASIWERIIDKGTGEVILSFSMLTINAEGHEVMKHFHKPHDEKRSIVLIDDVHYSTWLNANHTKAKELLQLAQPGILISEAASIARKLTK